MRPRDAAPALRPGGASAWVAWVVWGVFGVFGAAAWIAVGPAPALGQPPDADASAGDGGPQAQGDAGGEPVAPSVTPPRAVRTVEALYPPSALAERREATVELLVTVRADGTVGEVSVASSGGEAFDAAAVEAIRQWTFEPARRDGRPIDARVRVPFRFALPPTPESSATDEDPGPPAPPAPEDDANDDATIDDEAEEAPIEVVVRGERPARTEERSASDFRLDREVLAAAPRQEGAELLRSAPGLYLGRAEGLAVAHNYMLRGFDAGHGQDIEFHVAGLPINARSHIHGQGYADLGFLIGDVVRRLDVSEGVYDPKQGDFAVAGSIDVELGVPDDARGVQLRTSYGRWNTFRQLARWAPRGAEEESFGAVQYTRTDGFGDNRGAQAGSGLFQHRFGEGEVTYRLVGLLHTARADSAGVVRRDDVDAGRVCFTCVYPYPTARAQNTLANRLMAGFFVDYEGERRANGQLGLWLGYDGFRTQTNFTGFIQQSRLLERVAGRGDLIEQQNQAWSAGLTGRYRTARFEPAPWARGTLELGLDGRVDLIGQRQNLLDASVRNQTWDRRVDADIRGVDLGLWLDLDWAFSDYVQVRAGVRADVLSYDVEDALGNFVPITRPRDSFLPGFRRSAMGLAVGPRASVEVAPTSWLTIVAAYGEGYRSPQARLLEDGEDAPFTKVRSADLGLRVDAGDPLQLNVAGFFTRLSDDVAFDPDEGRLERIGATQRLGVAASLVTRPTDWLVGALSVTFVDATLREPPPATAEEPQPPFTKGQHLPFVPPVVVRADMGARHVFADALAGQPVALRGGLGLSFLSSRPLPYGQVAAPVGLLDLSAGVSWGPLELTLELFNALDARYAAVEYSFASDWDPDDGVRPRTPARHIAAGSPRSWMLSLGVAL